MGNAGVSLKTFYLSLERNTVWQWEVKGEPDELFERSQGVCLTFVSENEKACGKMKHVCKHSFAAKTQGIEYLKNTVDTPKKKGLDPMFLWHAMIWADISARKVNSWIRHGIVSMTILPNKSYFNSFVWAPAILLPESQAEKNASTHRFRWLPDASGPARRVDLDPIRWLPCWASFWKLSGFPYSNTHKCTSPDWPRRAAWRGMHGASCERAVRKEAADGGRHSRVGAYPCQTYWIAWCLRFLGCLSVSLCLSLYVGAAERMRREVWKAGLLYGCPAHQQLTE